MTWNRFPARVRRAVPHLAGALVVLALAGVVSSATARAGAPATWDLTYGTAGKNFPDFAHGSPSRPVKMALDSSGRAVTFITVNSYRGRPLAKVMRTTTSGVVDASFGTSGFTTARADESAMGGAIQNDGKILLLTLAETDEYPTELHLYRYDATGSIDSSFGTAGMATISASSGRHWYNFFYETASDPAFGQGRYGMHVRAFVVVQSTGRMVVAGTTSSGDAWSGLTDGRIESIGISASGSVDATYGSSGHDNFVPNPAGSSVLLNDMILDSSNRPVMVATDNYGGSHSEWVIRRTAAGGVDLSWDGDSGAGNGYFQSEIGVSRIGGVVALGPSSSIYVAGWRNGASSVEVVKYGSTGIKDNTFGASGVAVAGDSMLNGNDMKATGPTAMVVQADGKIIVAYGSDYLPFLARLTTGGTMDTAWGDGGRRQAVIDPGVVASLARQADGKLVMAAAHGMWGDWGEVEQVELARFAPADGLNDVNFADNGWLEVTFNELHGTSTDTLLRVDSLGRLLVITEWRAEFRTPDEAVVETRRYNANGTASGTWGIDGVSSFGGSATTLDIRDAVVTPSDGLLLLVNRWTNDAGNSTQIVRLTQDGYFDSSMTGPNNDEWGTATLVPPVRYMVGNSLSLGSTGKLLVSGQMMVLADPQDPQSGVDAGFVARLDSSGAYDTTFDGPSGTGDGTVVIGSNVGWSRIDANGKIVLLMNDGQNLFVERLTGGGQVDATFGTAGRTVLDVGARYSNFAGMNPGNGLIEASGKIVVTGVFSLGLVEYGLAVARMNANGSLDPSFDGDSGTSDGLVVATYPSHPAEVHSLGLFPLGSGYVTVQQQTGATRFDTLNADGSHSSSVPGGTLSLSSGWARSAVPLPDGNWMISSQDQFRSTLDSDFLGRVLQPLVATTTTAATTTSVVTTTTVASTTTSVVSTTMAPTTTVVAPVTTVVVTPQSTTVTTSPTTATTSPAPATTIPVALSGSSIPPAVRLQPVLSRTSRVSARSIAVWLGVTVPARAKLSLLAGRTFVTVCRASGTYVRGVKPGKCTLTLVVTVTKGKKISVTKKKATLTVS